MNKHNKINKKERAGERKNKPRFKHSAQPGQGRVAGANE
jgi:hypothetical protein